MDPETTERFAKLMCERDAEIVRLKFQSNAHRDAQIEGLQEIATLRARLTLTDELVEQVRLEYDSIEHHGRVWYWLQEAFEALAAHAQSQPEKK